MPRTREISIPSRSVIINDSIIWSSARRTLPLKLSACALPPCRGEKKARRLLLLTFGTNAENLERGIRDPEFLFLAALFLNPVELFADEFNDVAALEADEVIVPRPAERLLVAGMIFAEGVFRNQTAVDQEVERIIDGRPGGLQS